MLFSGIEPCLLMVSNFCRLGQVVNDEQDQVTAFSNSQKAFEAYKTRPDHFDLIITDMTMPIMTGVELAEKILLITPQKPLILCTGFSELISREKAKALGISAFLLKPVLRKDLSEAIRKALDE